jgi:hypothetical protein
MVDLAAVPVVEALL